MLRPGEGARGKGGEVWKTLKVIWTSRECDDAAIAEGYSESVARILVDHWRRLSRLAHLASRDADSRYFVIQHVDETLTTEDVKKIRANADKRCPTGLRDLCHDLRKQTE